MNDEQLAVAYRAMIASRPREGRSGCADPGALLALVEQSGTEVTRLSTLDHVMSCGACLKEFELLRAVRLGITPPARRAPVRWWRPIAAAAVLTLTVGGLLWTRSHRGDAAEPERGGSARLIGVAPSGNVAQPTGALRFVWTSVSGATTYDIQITRDNGTMIYATATIDTLVALPDSVTVLSGHEYRWTVTARIIDSTTVRSTPTRFTVR